MNSEISKPEIQLGKPWTKFYRSEPIRTFNVEQTLYSLVYNANKYNMDMNFASYLGDEISFSDLFKTTDALAEVLHEWGVDNNDKVGACMLTVPETAPVLLAVSKLGAVSCWLDGSLKSADLLKNINQLELHILIVHQLLLPQILPIISESLLERIIVVEADKRLNFPKFTAVPPLYSFSDVIAAAPEPKLKAAEYERNKTTVIVQSSGSTGMPKLIEHTDYNFNTTIESMAFCDLRLFAGRRALVCAPPWVIYGLSNSIYSGLVLGNETVYTTLPHEEQILENIGNFDYVYGVPVYIRFLYNTMCNLKKHDIEQYNALKAKVQNIDFIISGGDKVTTEEVTTWQLMFDVPVLNGYGNNEVCGAATVCPALANRPGSIGIPLKGNIIKAFDQNTGEMLPDGTIGEIGIAPESLFKGYFGAEHEAKKLLFTANNHTWIKTGDLGYTDSDGFVYIRGRSRRLIIDKLGYKISPDHGESVIQSCVGVAECAIVGAKRGEHDFVPVAYIELNGDSDSNIVLETVKTACQTELKDYEYPKKYIVIDKIPHKANGGKLDFLQLEELASALQWD